MAPTHTRTAGPLLGAVALVLLSGCTATNDDTATQPTSPAAPSLTSIAQPTSSTTADNTIPTHTTTAAATTTPELNDHGTYTARCEVYRTHQLVGYAVGNNSYEHTAAIKDASHQVRAFRAKGARTQHCEILDTFLPSGAYTLSMETLTSAAPTTNSSSTQDTPSDTADTPTTAEPAPAPAP